MCVFVYSLWSLSSNLHRDPAPFPSHSAFAFRSSAWLHIRYLKNTANQSEPSIFIVQTLYSSNTFLAITKKKTFKTEKLFIVINNGEYVNMHVCVMFSTRWARGFDLCCIWVESTLLSTPAELPELFHPPNTPDTSAVIAETSSARKKERNKKRLNQLSFLLLNEYPTLHSHNSQN